MHENITPINTKEEKKQVINCQPISLTSILLKFFEKITMGKIVEFLEKNKMITENQHGFRSNKSCLTIFFYIRRVLAKGKQK